MVSHGGLDPGAHVPGTGSSGDGPIDEPSRAHPSCSNALPLGLIIAGIVAALSAAGILYYMGSLPCGIGLYVALGIIVAGAGLMVGAIAAWTAYLKCLGEPDPCPNASTIKRMITAAAGIFATIAAAVVGGASGSTGLCAIPIFGWLASVISSATTAIIAASMLAALAAMLGLIIGLMVQYDKCRKANG